MRHSLMIGFSFGAQAPRRRGAHLRLPILAVSLMALGSLAALPAAATPQPYQPAMIKPIGAPAAPMRTDIQTGPVRTQVIDLPKGRSAVIDLPADAGDVFVSNPEVTDAVLRTPRRVFIMGVNSGVSDVLFFDGNGRQILNLSVRVDAATDELSDTVRRLFPNTHVDVQSLNGQVVLSGMAADDGQADQIVRLAQSFADKPEHVINLMSVAGKDQVTLKVRVIEVDRTTIKQLGFANSFSLSGANGATYSLSEVSNFGVNNALLGGVAGGYNYVNGTTSVLSNIEAFERVGLARTLAEPNLTTVSGEGAKFLAGGEFPVPISEDNEGRVSVEFKQFGVGLGFTPVVLSSGRISLHVSSEVSELTNTGAFTSGSSASSSTLTIPALTVRRAETTVEMTSGSSMMIAGLLQSNVKQSLAALPGLTTLPIIGALFRSRDFENDETEMVIIITPYVVRPGDPDQFQTPADNLQVSGDAAAVFMGRLNKVIDGGVPTATAAPRQPYQAPVGYVIE